MGQRLVESKLSESSFLRFGCLKVWLPSSTRMEVLVRIEELQDVYQMAVCIPWGTTGTRIYCRTLASWLLSSVLHSFVPLGSFTTETCSGTSIVSRLSSQNGLGLKWFLLCQKATSGSFPLRTPYPICLHYGLIAIYIHLKYLLSTFYVSSTVPRAGAIKTNNMSS